MEQKSTSLWHATASAPRFDSLRGDIETDVVVIGAGITGLTAALLLAAQGRRVAVIEKEVVGGGDTGNTTAHITAAVDARYHFIKRKYGEEEARLVASGSVAAIETIAGFVETHSIECRFRRLPGYLYTENRKYVSELKNEATAAREAGLDVEFVQQVPLPFPTRGAVLWRDQAQFHPHEYMAGLAKAAARAGVQIFERTLATHVEDGERCVVETPGGRLTARAVVMASYVPIEGFNQIHVLASAYRTYAVAMEAAPDHPDGLFWDTADPYHYTRLQETDAGRFLIVGGEDHRVGEEEDTDAAFERLVAYAKQYFGDHPIRYRWSGQIIEPHGGLPFIGGRGNIYISTGYAGQGMTLGTLGGMIVSDLIAGIENRWAALFDPRRIRADVTTREFITENVHFPAHLAADRLTSADVEATSLDEVHSGEAKIVELDGRKVAAYRDGTGVLHTVSPVCTHMKCDVSWNPAETSWDCPCHGSRFTPEGDVLNGPANQPLEKVTITVTK